MSTKNICILVSDYRDELTTGFVIGIEQQAAKLGYTTTAFSMLQLSERFLNSEDVVYRFADFNSYAGVILISRSFSSHIELLNALERRLQNECNVPVISIGNSGCFDVSPDFSAYNILEELTDHLIDTHACRKIYFLGGEKELKEELFHGQLHSLSKHGIDAPESWFLYGGYWTPCAEKLARDIAFDEIERPDAVMCVSDVVAMALIKSFSRYGVRVPEDVIVTGFGGLSCTSNSALSVTTAPTDTHYSGKCAVNMLHTRITGEEPAAPQPRTIRLFTGISCGCGVKKMPDVRLQLEQLDKHDLEKMRFRNSRLEEHLYSARNRTELVNAIKNLVYLIPDRRTLGVNLTDSAGGLAECIFLSGSVNANNPLTFPAALIYPIGHPIRPILHTHVLPLIFNQHLYGYLTIGYEAPCVPDQSALQFAARLSVALMIQALRAEEPTQLIAPRPVATPSTEDALPERIPGNTSFVASKNGIISRLSPENILFFEATNKKVFATTKNGEYEIKQRLYEIEALLKERNFLRISKSTIVNLDKIVSYRPDSDRTLVVFLSNKQTVRVSRSFVDDFRNAFH